MNIKFYKHNINNQDIELVNKVIESDFLSTGREVEEFEKDFADYFKVKYCLGTTNCSSALLISLKALGVGEGAEVITTPLAYPATANAIELAGAKVRFVDVNRETGLLNEDLIEENINENTRAIIPIHLYGRMLDMRRVYGLVQKYNLKIIEDAAQAIEGERDNYQPGKFSDITVFSFYTLKAITSGEGGSLISNNKELYDKLKLLRYHGLKKIPYQRIDKSNYIPYEMTHLGYKFNMNNIQAALLINQLKRINVLWSSRKKIVEKYNDAFNKIKQIKLLNEIPNCKSAYHLYTIQVDKEVRDDLLKYLKEKGVEVTINYYPIHLLAYYQNRYGYKLGDFPNAENIGSGTITLPLYPKLKDQEVKYIIGIVRDYFK